MVAKETQLDYLCRLAVDSKSTNKSLDEVRQSFVNFILKYDLDLGGQSGIRYVNFREYGFEKPIVGGFGSRTLLGKILINNNFDINSYSNKIKNKILSLYDKIDFEVQISDENLTFSLNNNYQDLEDIEYLEFVYNLSIMTYARYDKESAYYPECQLIIRQYLADIVPNFNVINGSDLPSYSGDLIITGISKLNNLEDIELSFMIYHKNIFCKKHDLDSSLPDSDLYTLISILEC